MYSRTKTQNLGNIEKDISDYILPSSPFPTIQSREDILHAKLSGSMLNGMPVSVVT